MIWVGMSQTGEGKGLVMRASLLGVLLGGGSEHKDKVVLEEDLGMERSLKLKDVYLNGCRTGRII